MSQNRGADSKWKVLVIVPSVRGNLVYRVSLTTGNIEVNVQKLVTESIHYKGELDSIKFDMAGVKAEATGVNVFVTSMQKHIGVLTNNMTMYVLCSSHIFTNSEFSISIWFWKKCRLFDKRINLITYLFWFLHKSALKTDQTNFHGKN